MNANLLKLAKNLEKAVEAFEFALREEIEPIVQTKDYELEIEINRSWQYSTRSFATKISYRFHSDYEANVTGNAIIPIIDKWKRRKGWNEIFTPRTTLELEAPQAQKELNDDEIPF